MATRRSFATHQSADAADTVRAGRAARPRRSLALRLAVASALLALAGARALPAYAEIIDFDPAADVVPDLVTPDERSLLSTATTIDYPYFLSEPNPGGTLSLAFVQTEPVFIDLANGDQTPFDVMPPSFGPGPEGVQFSRLGLRWLDDATLEAMVLRIESHGEDMPPTFSVERVAINAADGTWASEPVPALTDVAQQIQSFSPDLSRALILKPEQGGSMPNSVKITLGATPFTAPDGRSKLPEGLPGVRPANELGVEYLQQAAFTYTVVDAATGDETPLDLHLPADTTAGRIAWRPDGQRLALGTRTMPDWDGDRQRDNTPPAQGLPNLGSINVREALGLVKPEDNPLLTGTAIHILDTTTGQLVKRLQNADFPQGLFSNLQFAPDGQRALLTIVKRSDLDDRTYPTYDYPTGIELDVLDAQFAVARTITGEGLDNLGTSATWVGDTTLIIDRPAELNRLYLSYDVTTGQSTTWWDQPGAAYQSFIRPHGAAMLFTRVDAPPELVAWGDLAADAELPAPENDARLLTEVNPDAGELAAELRTEPVSWTTSNGRRMSGVIVHRAADAWPPAKPGPLVVWQQGGPGGQMTNDYGGSVESPYSVLPHFGLPVFIANAAGRSVQDAQFFGDMAEGRNFGQLDIAQIKEGVESLSRARLVDPRRVGITGCSYGGYFTLQSLRTYPDFYAAGNAQCSLTDLTEEFTFGYTPFIAYLMGRTPFVDPQEYLKDSPFYGTKDITAPSLLFQGTDDFLPVPLMANIHDQLEANGTEVTFLRVEGEGHGFGNPHSQAYAGQLQLEFFRKHLLRELPDLPEPPHGGTIYLPAVVRNFDAAEAPTR
ncbi:MAG: prolyl oligopeptidase family serine peptidase [Ardenticatenales bacterium]